MYLYKQKLKNGDVYLAIREKYYVPGKGTRERTFEKIGRLSVLSQSIEDPISYFTQYAKELTEKVEVEKSKTTTINPTETMDVGTDDLYNVGYGIFKEIYKQLELDKFWNWKIRGKKIKFSIDKVFCLLVLSRVLNPGSKKYTLDNKHFFFEPFDDITLDDIYHALDIIAENNEALQKWIFEHSKKICERDISVSYFDCTNFYFDIGRPDVDILSEEGKPVDESGNPIPAKYRKRGPEKNKRPDPIVSMGLLIDKNGIPVAYDLFPGNESEKVHMRPIINRVKKDCDNCRVIYVADRGLNTSDNIYWLNGDNKGENNRRDGYVYGQSIRGADAQFKEWVLAGGYKRDRLKDEDGNEITFVHKSRIFPKELQVNVTKPGRKKPIKKTIRVDQKQMVYYSEKYAKKQKADRDAMIARAKDLIRYPKKYDRVTSKGSAAYVKNITFDKNTGEVIEGKNLVLDLEKIREEEKYDGYYSIVTSELSMSDRDMRKVYKGLAKIEASFKVTKTCLKSRPIYVWLNEHIDAHFATCFLSLVLIRVLEHKLKKRYSTEKILNSLKRYSCVYWGVNTWKFIYYDEILDACASAFGMKLNGRYKTRQEIQRLLRY